MYSKTFKISNIILLLFTLFFPLVTINAQSDTLEQAYKDQHDQYTLEIKELESSINIGKASLEKQREVADKLYELDARDNSRRSRYGRAQTNKLTAGITEQAEYLQKKINKLGYLKEKKGELKIRLLEKYTKLPEWWVEESTVATTDK